MALNGPRCCKSSPTNGSLPGPQESRAGGRDQDGPPVDAGGVTCSVRTELTIGGRTAPMVSAWHYSDAGAAPRLVTAYPTAYNPVYGSNS